MRLLIYADSYESPNGSLQSLKSWKNSKTIAAVIREGTSRASGLLQPRPLFHPCGLTLSAASLLPLMGCGFVFDFKFIQHSAQHRHMDSPRTYSVLPGPQA